VIASGYCMHCGACAGLNPELIAMEETPAGPLPRLRREPALADAPRLRLAWAVCPGRGVPFPELFDHLGRAPHSWLLGPVRAIYLAHAADEGIRRRAASGGVITALLLHLLETGRVAAALVVRVGVESAERAGAVLARTRQEVLASSQSVYEVVPTLHLLAEIARVDGPVAAVALPEQAAAIRLLQAAGHEGASKISFLAGPYVGTNMYRGAVRAFLAGHGVAPDEPIRSLEWRAGEWPGRLRVELEDGRIFEAPKFYYNYLTPFYMARNTLLTPDFTNELADVSVGDAWAPELEAAGGGHSVVIARSEAACGLLAEMRQAGLLVLEKISAERAIAMHAHMIDFKKRGAFLRLEHEARRGRPVPVYGYRPAAIPASRRVVERVIGLFLWVGRRRRLLGLLPPSAAGPLFAGLRRAWKRVSKPLKRRGLASTRFLIEPNPERWNEIREAGRGLHEPGA
jgi:coenzyme F420 hydrogenase subunit beta